MTQSDSLADLLDPVLAIAVAAGREILDVYQSDFAVTTKDDASPLTQADLRAHRAIIAGLYGRRPVTRRSDERAAGNACGLCCSSRC